MDFDLRQLEIFCRVVELGSFTKAAEAVFLAQASVSERVANLEAAVGAKLLDRLGRKITPTRAGEHLYRQALVLLDMKKSLSLEMEAFLGMERGEVRLGGSTIPGEYLLPAVLGGFRSRHPGISVRLEIADTHEVSRRILEGALELGVIGSRVQDKRLLHQELWRDELVLAVPSGHHWWGLDAVPLDELRNESFIIREQGSGTQKIMEERLGEVMGSFRIGARLGSSTAVKEGVKAGLGIAVLSLRAMETEIRAGELAAVRVKGLSMGRRFYLVQDRRRAESPPCRALRKYLLETHDLETPTDALESTPARRPSPPSP
ncbi:MAG: selenium metabolism-associated LysR family transcriptional regulator [Desulfobacteraceae bacterium]